MKNKVLVIDGLTSVEVGDGEICHPGDTDKNLMPSFGAILMCLLSIIIQSRITLVITISHKVL